jgi:hypothetical protein
MTNNTTINCDDWFYNKYLNCLTPWVIEPLKRCKAKMKNSMHTTFPMTDESVAQRNRVNNMCLFTYRRLWFVILASVLLYLTSHYGLLIGLSFTVVLIIADCIVMSVFQVAALVNNISGSETVDFFLSLAYWTFAIVEINDVVGGSARAFRTVFIVISFFRIMECAFMHQYMEVVKKNYDIVNDVPMENIEV